LLISTVIADATNFQVLAIAEISAPALAARVVLPAMPTYAHALPLFPGGNAGTHFVDDARHFVSWNAGILNSGPQAFFREHVTMAHTASLHFDPNVPCIRRRNLALDDFEIRSGLGHLGRFHLRHLHWYDSAGCHKSSYEASLVVETHLPKIARHTIRLPQGHSLLDHA
jgi:hypothetical protein